VRSSDGGRLRALRAVRPNPESSTTGLLATHALYQGAPDTNEARRAVERDVRIGGDDPRALLCQLRLTPKPWPPSAFLVPENVLDDFNEGRPLGGPCARALPPLQREQTEDGRHD